MAHIWKEIEEADQKDPSGGLFQETSTARAIRENNITFAEMKKKPVRAFVEIVEKWCDRHNPETSGRSKSLSKVVNLNCYEPVKNTIISNYSNGEIFTTPNILKIIDPNGLSDGNRQRKIMAYMVCLGSLSKVLVTCNKEGKLLKKPYYNYKFNLESQKCPYLNEFSRKNGKKYKACSFDWKDKAHITQFFQKEDSPIK